MSFTRKMKRRNKPHNGNHSWVHKRVMIPKHMNFGFASIVAKKNG